MRHRQLCKPGAFQDKRAVGVATHADLIALGFDKRSSCGGETRDEALRRFVWEATVCVLFFVACRKEEGDKATD